MEPLILSIVPSSPAEIYEPQHIGGKAHYLQQVSVLGLHVPRSWVIPTNEYMTHLNQPLIQQIIQRMLHVGSDRSNWSLIQETIIAAPIRLALIKALTDFYDNHSSKTGWKPLSVRSSANVEDGLYHSFAGIFTSTTGLRSIEEVLNSIKRCWSSVWSPRAADYSRRIGVVHQHIQMAVLIQETVSAHAAGVAFTCDPLSLNPEHFIIETASQEGEAIVSGCISPDYYRLSSETGKVQTYNSNVPGKAILSNTDLAWLWMAVKTIREQFDDNQEIEWIIDSYGEGYILQTRSITTIYRGSRRDHSKPDAD